VLSLKAGKTHVMFKTSFKKIACVDSIQRAAMPMFGAGIDALEWSEAFSAAY